MEQVVLAVVGFALVGGAFAATWRLMTMAERLLQAPFSPPAPVTGAGLAPAIAAGQATPSLKAPPLDTVLMHWTPNDPLTLRQLLDGGIFICGRPGSGKSSSSAYRVLEACVNLPQSGGLIPAASPGDLAMVQPLFARHPGRLVVFSEKSSLRFNALDYILQRGGSTKDCLAGINAIVETVGRGKGEGSDGENGSFFSQGGQRILENAIIVTKHAKGKLSMPDMLTFINTAASSLEEVHSAEFKQTFHYQCLAAAYDKEKSESETFDYELARAYWTQEHPKMADRTRTSLVAVVMNILHMFNTGINRMLFSTSTNITPEVMDQGKWIFVDMPISRCGEEGAFALGLFKWMTQWHTLRRDSSRANPPLIILADEIHNILNRGDTRFLGEGRKFGGCMIACTQSRASFYANMRGESAEAQVDALLNNFSHKIIHVLGDVDTAEWASKLVGDEMQFTYGGSEQSPPSMLDEVAGHGVWTASLNEGVRPIMLPREFMYGFRTGGAINNNLCDAVLIRSGKGCIRVVFKQPKVG